MAKPRRSTKYKEATTTGAVIGLDNVESFYGYVITWFADVATTYLINKRLSSDVKGDIGDLCKKAKEYASKLEDKSPKIPLASNDKNHEEMFTVEKAVEMICKSPQEVYKSQGTFSPEFMEYVRYFMPVPKEGTLRRNAVKVESVLHGLAVIGTYISFTCRVKDEFNYTFVNIVNPRVVNYERLMNETISVVRSVRINELSKLSLIVGVASVIVLNYGKLLLESEYSRGVGLKTEFLRLVGSRRKIYKKKPLKFFKETFDKVLVKAFETVDVTDLARCIWRLGVALPVYILISDYPGEGKAGHMLRSFIEDLSKAILIYESFNDPAEIYRVLRSLTSEEFQKNIRSCYERSDEIVDGLLRIRLK